MGNEPYVPPLPPASQAVLDRVQALDTADQTFLLIMLCGTAPDAVGKALDRLAEITAGGQS